MISIWIRDVKKDFFILKNLYRYAISAQPTLQEASDNVDPDPTHCSQADLVMELIIKESEPISCICMDPDPNCILKSGSDPSAFLSQKFFVC